MQDIDGLLVQPPFHAVPRYHILVAESLGIYAKTLCDSTMMGGASYGVALHLAKWADRGRAVQERPHRRGREAAHRGTSAAPR